jgi:hypothetical protein
VEVVVDLGEEGELAGAELRLRRQEAAAPRLLAEAQEEACERGLVARADRPDGEARAVREAKEAGDGGRHVPVQTAARRCVFPGFGHPHHDTPDSTHGRRCAGWQSPRNPKRTRTHTLTPPLFQLLYAPIYQAPRLAPAGMPATRRPVGAR